MAQGGMSRTGLAVAGLALLILPGCAVNSISDKATRIDNLVSLYPVGPVNQNFTCLGAEHEDADRVVAACFATKEAQSLGKRLQAADGTKLLPHPPDACTCDLGKSTCLESDSCIDTALGCTAATRNSYADFLRCREDFQMLAGTAITTVAAASGAVSLGVSAVAGAALGSVAAAGLGADYIGYNSVKSAAYATATSQLQCVIYDTSNLVGTLPGLKGQQALLRDALNACTAPTKSDDLNSYLNISAEKAIAYHQIAFLQMRYQRIGLDIFATTQNIDVRAFSGSQTGVPTASTIQSALQAENAIVSNVPSAKGAAPAAPNVHKNVCPPLQPTECTREDLKNAETSASNIRTMLRQIILPQQGFPDCMALSTSAPAGGTSSATSSSGGGGGSGSGTAGAAGASTPSGGAQNPTPAQKPVAVPFQVLPVSAPGGQGAGSQGGAPGQP